MPARASSDGRSLSDFLRHNAAEGSIRLPDGQRLLAISEPLIHGLHAALRETLGDSARDALYRAGYEWALQDMMKLNQVMRDEFGSESFDLWQMDARFVLDRWWSPLSATGWGLWKPDLSAIARGVVLIELQHSIVASGQRGASQPVCDLYAGMFAGALSFFDRAERHCIELQCQAVGGDHCLFVAGPGPEIDRAETARRENVPVTEIVCQLH